MHRGFCYRKDSAGIKKQSWRCVKCSKYRCHARVHTQEGKVVRQVGFHNHDPETSNVYDSSLLVSPYEVAAMSLTPCESEILPE